MKKLYLSLFLIGLMFAASVSAVSAAPRLYFEPATSSETVGGTFDVVVKVDTGEEETMAVDAIISFDATKLKVNQVVEGDFLPNFDYDLENSNGKLSIWNFAQDTLSPQSGVGEIATITFEAESNGDASVSYLCEEGNDTDSAIWDPSGNDLIDCASNGSGTYSIGGTGGETSSPTPTSTASATATPSELPETGIETPLMVMGLGGIIVLLLSTVMAI